MTTEWHAGVAGEGNGAVVTHEALHQVTLRVSVTMKGSWLAKRAR